VSLELDEAEYHLHARALDWLEGFGPKACLLSWLPGVGDPLCAVAGWLKLPFWPCVMYMAIGKFARYVTMTAALREQIVILPISLTIRPIKEQNQSRIVI
jgi:membrane protein YqaA with SNARE-associated domain